jgi:hypothetical protein
MGRGRSRWMSVDRSGTIRYVQGTAADWLLPVDASVVSLSGDLKHTPVTLLGNGLSGLRLIASHPNEGKYGAAQAIYD